MEFRGLTWDLSPSCVLLFFFFMVYIYSCINFMCQFILGATNAKRAYRIKRRVLCFEKSDFPKDFFLHTGFFLRLSSLVHIHIFPLKFTFRNWIYGTEGKNNNQRFVMSSTYFFFSRFISLKKKKKSKFVNVSESAVIRPLWILHFLFSNYRSIKAFSIV